VDIRVFIIDKLALVRDGISGMLTGVSGINVLGSAADLNSGKFVIKNCDVLIIEHDKDLDSALIMIKEIHKVEPRVKIILLSDKPENPNFLNRVLEAGISGYMTKHAGSEELSYGIKKVAEDGIYICTAFILKFIETLPASVYHDKNLSSKVELNRGEREVLDLIAEGLTNRDIANKLFVSVRTIESRRKKLLEKTNTTNTATLIRFCLKAGLIH